MTQNPSFATSTSGLYIALEGIDTSGKSTQINALCAHYPQAIITKEPGGSEIGRDIRELILHTPNLDSLCEFFLFLADRAQHYHKVLKPNLDSHRLVISDRSLISGIAYAKDIPQAIAYNHTSIRGLKPHLCVLLLLDETHLRMRLGRKAHDKIEERGITYMLEIQERLRRFCELLEVRTLEIDAALPPEHITQAIVREIDSLK
ncbi:dTMP kinase [uncultured Helicobacter sp.]|uniref:dTMP kinase n=1 Tax=uncultured Helicobacter sp. TaxID=175537 RepID=UPI00374F5B5B